MIYVVTYLFRYSEGPNYSFYMFESYDICRRYDSLSILEFRRIALTARLSNDFHENYFVTINDGKGNRFTKSKELLHFSKRYLV